MNGARWRLVLAATGFLAWIGWLAYLAATTTRPVVLSRPQFLQADYWVIANLSGDEEHPDARAKVVEVFWSRKKPRNKREHINVSNLPEMRKRNGWQGPGQYILPLEKIKGTSAGRFQIVPIPPSPGYQPPSSEVRLYLDDKETRGQLEKMRAEHWEE